MSPGGLVINVFFQMSGFSAVQEVASEIKGMIEDFRPYIPLIQGLRNPGMRNRHWEQVRLLCFNGLIACYFSLCVFFLRNKPLSCTAVCAWMSIFCSGG